MTIPNLSKIENIVYIRFYLIFLTINTTINYNIQRYKWHYIDRHIDTFYRDECSTNRSILLFNVDSAYEMMRIDHRNDQ